MLKSAKLVKSTPRSSPASPPAASWVQGRLDEIFTAIPFLQVDRIERPRSGPDLAVHLKVCGKAHTLLCEIAASGQPRHVREKGFQLRSYLSGARPGTATGVIVAPYLSEQARSLAVENELGFLDDEGNCRIVFDGVFIDRQVPTRPAVQRRDLPSLFTPKSSQVLRVMLRDLSRSWRVVDLAEAADVSIGHVSNVRSALRNREWATADDLGVRLTEPDALLDSWRDAYEPPVSEQRLPFYTTLHGQGLQAAVKQGIADAQRAGHDAVLSGFSAAQWLAPYARTATLSLYADNGALEHLRDSLKLQPASKGENVDIAVLPAGSFILRDVIEPSAGLRCTPHVQTYLDLWTSGERGREAADHLRAETMSWRT